MENSKSKAPKISVLMGIYNCAETLPDAIESIVEQTYSDWELILCDDGSVDNTYEVAENYKALYPDKLVLLKNDRNIGLNATLNRCLSAAKGSYIARMDGDDKCDANRFAAEVEVLKTEKEIAIVSTDMSFFDETGVWGRISHPEYPTYKDFIAGSPFCHAPCMVRREAYEAVRGYSESKWLLRVEDYHLWVKMYAVGFRGKNINSALYQMRDDRNAYARRKFRYRINEAYVKLIAIRTFKLPLFSYIFVLRPILVGLMPRFFYDLLHKKKLGMPRK